MSEVTAMNWFGFTVVRISEVPGFAEWLYGQTTPYIDEDAEPCNWAYFEDYYRFIKQLPIID